MVLKIFFGDPTVVVHSPVPQFAPTLHHRGVSNWKLQRVARPGQPADNEPLAAPAYAARRQVWITRLGSYTRVVLVAPGVEDDPESAPTVSKQSWA